MLFVGCQEPVRSWETRFDCSTCECTWRENIQERNLKDVAILGAFYEGAKGGKQDIVEEYYGHPAIHSWGYAWGLYASWDHGKPNQVFRFLLKQADQGDLDKAKESMRVGKIPSSHWRNIQISPIYRDKTSRLAEKTDVEETSTDTVPLVTFPDPIQVTFDDKGVPILNGMDPTEVPIAGLSILERVERAKRLREERLKKGTET